MFEFPSDLIEEDNDPESLLLLLSPSSSSSSTTTINESSLEVSTTNSEIERHQQGLKKYEKEFLRTNRKEIENKPGEEETGKFSKLFTLLPETNRYKIYFFYK